MSRFVTDGAVEIALIMRGELVSAAYREAPYSIVPYQTTRNCGGRGHGRRPRDERGEPLPAELGRAERLRPGACASRRNAGYDLERPGPRARLLVGEGDQAAISEKPQPARRVMPAPSLHATI